jgi:hypothetical protein
LVKKKIAIVGCGNIGSRHLQAVAKLPFPCTVHIVEPSKAAQRLAKSRLSEVPHANRSNDFKWNSSVHELKGEFDLSIVATSSVGRAEIINQMLELGHLRFLVEKMVCQSAREYTSLIKRLCSFGAKGWVNTPRRYYGSYQKIKSHFHKDSVHMSVVAGNEGLGSNAIHFIDLFLWLCNKKKLRLNGALLDNHLFTNKRGSNLLEFAGTITGVSGGGSSLNISFLAQEPKMPLLVTTNSRKTCMIINESAQEMLKLGPKAQASREEFKNENVSDTTTKIAKDILFRDECLLATVSDSYSAHAELFRIFNAHIRKLTKEARELCPIT